MPQVHSPALLAAQTRLFHESIPPPNSAPLRVTQPSTGEPGLAVLDPPSTYNFWGYPGKCVFLFWRWPARSIICNSNFTNIISSWCAAFQVKQLELRPSIVFTKLKDLKASLHNFGGPNWENSLGDVQRISSSQKMPGTQCHEPSTGGRNSRAVPVVPLYLRLRS